MSDEKSTDQGVHYHYHFYGTAPGADAGQGNGQGYGQGGPGQGGQGQGGYGQGGYGQGGQGQGGYGPGQGAPFGGPAGQMPPGFPPAGFPFGPSAGQNPGQAGGANAGQAGAQASGFNWHQHPNADSLIKGLAVGAAAAYLLTNETAQRTIMRTAVQVWSFLQGGVEELKERLHDAEAEVAAATQPPAPAAEEPVADLTAARS
ncbi:MULTISPECIES: hypothetical protein [unclassified Xanthobacter]|uniref:hypothetical protein n=1 Tax=unclassified Xanthobacter TaxID=2623496 RepID=UPI001EDFCED2|nr:MULTISPECIES: hypothetical protein [unclassified Xanthobacter]